MKKVKLGYTAVEIDDFSYFIEFFMDIDPEKSYEEFIMLGREKAWEIVGDEGYDEVVYVYINEIDGKCNNLALVYESLKDEA